VIVNHKDLYAGQRWQRGVRDSRMGSHADRYHTR
jgi:hypothetical protein